MFPILNVHKLVILQLTVKASPSKMRIWQDSHVLSARLTYDKNNEGLLEKVI